ncbi:hypothetical protein ACFU8T_20495, partial [Sphingobacterium spiritivorum]|uniref:hypothetical protein n=1 Tax=Sphingobacterium spiritivorum TaxID=258 RepID=UPI0036D1EBD2
TDTPTAFAVSTPATYSGTSNMLAPEKSQQLNQINSLLSKERCPKGREVSNPICITDCGWGQQLTHQLHWPLSTPATYSGTSNMLAPEKSQQLNQINSLLSKERCPKG